MEYKPFEPFKALNPGEAVCVYLTEDRELFEIVALHETYFFGENKPGWEWDIVYETVKLEDGKTCYFTSRFLWTLDDAEEASHWGSEEWAEWLNGDTSYMYGKDKFKRSK